MQTRSSHSSKRPAPVHVDARTPKRHNTHWAITEEREMIRLRRHENKTYVEIAAILHRLPEAIKLRFEKLVAEHIEGGHSEAEALRWFNLDSE